MLQDINDEEAWNDVLWQCYKILMMSKLGIMFYDNVTRYKYKWGAS